MDVKPFKEQSHWVPAFAGMTLGNATLPISSQVLRVNDIDIQHDSTGHRFFCEVDGHTGFVEYRRDGDVLTILHTDVPEQIGGRGIASRLVRTALDYARAEGLKVVPRCSYTAAWIDRHPDYADLRV